MPRFLDLQTSSNSSTFGSPNTAMSTNPANPDLFGGIGLETQNVTGIGGGTAPGGLVVDLTGTIGVSAIAGLTVEIRIVRNSGTIAGPVIYTALHSTLAGNNLINFSAQDLNAPAGLLTTYAAFCDVVGVLALVTRVGPEVFYGIAAEG